MGKGLIISGGSGGFYSVQLIFDRTRVNSRITNLETKIAGITTRIDAMEDGKEKGLLVLLRTSYQKNKQYLETNMPADPVVSAWCADLTEDLSGYVGTIEVPGERGVVQIQPGYGGNAAYNAARDGQLQPSIAGTPESVFYNLALLPGWQKWKPTFRHGTITALAGNICAVDLDTAVSSQQGLNVNQADILYNVPIAYMANNGDSFEIGDAVLVEFVNRDWSMPRVIGFKDNPVDLGLILDPDMELDLGWSLFQAVCANTVQMRSSEQAYNGTYSRKVSHLGFGFPFCDLASMQTIFTRVVNMPVRVSLWVWPGLLKTEGFSTVRLEIRLQRIIDGVWQYEYRELYETDAPETGFAVNQWNYFSQIIEHEPYPNGTEVNALVIGVTNGGLGLGTSFSWYFDNLSVELI